MFVTKKITHTARSDGSRSSWRAAASANLFIAVVIPAVGLAACCGAAVAQESRLLAPPASVPLEPPPVEGEAGSSRVASAVENLGPLAAVLAASAGVLASLKLWQRFGGAHAGSAPRSATELLSRTAVGPRQNVLLLRVGRRVLVVAQADGTLSTLADIDQPEEVEALLGAFGETGDRPPLAEGFGSRLEKNLGQDDRRGGRRSAEQALADRLRGTQAPARAGGRRVA